MDQKPVDQKPGEPNVRALHPAPSLVHAVRRARTEAADQSQVIAELRGAEFARLEMLADAVTPVLAQVPDTIDLFDAGLVPGDRPRFFVDMLGFVEMARDRRTYSFVQDTRHGRITLAESDKIETMVEKITAYIARRLVEREMALASDMTPAPAPMAGQASSRISKLAAEGGRAAAPATPTTASGPRAASPARPKHRFFFTALLFTVELLGSIVLFAVIAAVLYYGWIIGWQMWGEKLLAN